jgi:DNA polymerase III subunit delta'
VARILDRLIGHEIQIQRLLEAARIDRLASTLLFIGPPGVGKKLAARGIAQSLVCEKNRVACGECGPCIRIEKGESESFCLIEPVDIQVKIEQVKVIKDFTRLRLVSRARVAVIDEAHMMTPQSANSLLKVLEEPPPNTFFILISGQEAGLLPTLRSRCQTVRFSPLTIEQLRILTTGADWMLSSAQGRLDRVEDLKLDAELRQSAIQGFQILMQGTRFEAMTFYQPIVKDKEKALKICQWWQQLVRDCLVIEMGKGGLLNSDLESKLVSWSRQKSNRLEPMSLAILQLERDILSNVDRTLLFENFWKAFSAQPTDILHA